MGVLSGLPRLWEAGEVMPLITSPGEEQPHHTPLAALVDAGNFRALVAQLQQSWQAAFAQAETFRQVITLWAPHNLNPSQLQVKVNKTPPPPPPSLPPFPPPPRPLSLPLSVNRTQVSF